MTTNESMYVILSAYPFDALRRPSVLEDGYREVIEAAGLRVEDIRPNPYEFISERARNASAKYGVKSVSLLARKER